MTRPDRLGRQAQRLGAALFALVLPAFIGWAGFEWAVNGPPQGDWRNVFPGVLLEVVYWGTGLALVLRYFHRPGARVLFFLSQVVGVAVFIPHSYPDPRLAPFNLLSFSVLGLHFTAPLLLHFHLTFPRSLLSSRRWRAVLQGAYLTAVVAWLTWLSRRSPFWQAGIAYTVSMLLFALGVLVYVYRRRAAPQERLRLRLLLAGTLATPILIIFLDILPTALSAPFRLPAWARVVVLAAQPLSYAYAVVRQNIFGANRAFNRALTYLMLSAAIFALYLGIFWLIYGLLPPSPWMEVLVVSALTLLIGWNFDWVRRRVQRLADRLLYGGWYDYPGVVEAVSAALTACSARDQLTRVLVEQVPEMMKLRRARLWIGEAGRSEPPAPPEWAQFRYRFQTDPPAAWWVGSHKDGEPLSGEDDRILNTLAAQAEIALSNVLLIETLRRRLEEIRTSEQMLSRMQRQLLRSREVERARLARDLHDSPIQALVGLNIQLGLLLGEAGIAPPLKEALREIRAEVRQTLGELRQVCAELRPPMLDALGLGAALQALVDEWSEQNGIPVTFTAPQSADLRALPGEVAVNLYRVAQEALNNIAHHAQASSVAVQLAWDGHRLEMEIRDDGKGFPLPDTFSGLTSQGHFGLAGMRERVELIGGKFSLESAPGEGTRVRVVWDARD